MLLTIVTPAYNEEYNIPALYKRICEVLHGAEFSWEWIIVDDHSDDGTFEISEELVSRDERIRAIRLARNQGSHTAIACGIDFANGDCTAVLAADLQDPPDIIPNLVEAWRGGAQVVWAARSESQEKKLFSRTASKSFHWLMRRLTKSNNLSVNGADCFLIDRCVVEAVRRFRERSLNLFLLIAWMGFRQKTLIYDKHARVSGVSGWTLARKVKLAIDSITAFSYAPLRFLSLVGIGVAVSGFLYALIVIVRALSGSVVEGWASVMVVLLLMSGTQMVMLGILGEYLWRTLEESRGRPRYLVEKERSSSGIQRKTEVIKKASELSV